MANGGDEPPPLPDTNDPFVLLGIAPDADAQAIKRAYARMIKRYRPDKHPAAFQRIHEAFERARAPEQDPGFVVVDEVAAARRRVHGRARVMPGFVAAFETDPRRALQLVDGAIAAASEDRDIARTVLRRLGALAWHPALPADHVRATLRKLQLAYNTYVGELVERIEAELDVAYHLHGLALPATLDGFRPLRMAVWLDDRDAVRVHARTLALSLAADPGESLRQLGTLALVPRSQQALENLLRYELPYQRTRLDRLSPDDMTQLGTALYDIGHALHDRSMLVGIGGALVAAAMRTSWALALPAAGAGALLLATEDRRYRSGPRIALARDVGALGLPLDVAVRWIQLNTRLAGGLSMHVLRMDKDRELAIYLMLRTLVALAIS